MTKRSVALGSCQWNGGREYKLAHFQQLVASWGHAYSSRHRAGVRTAPHGRPDPIPGPPGGAN